MTAMLAEIAIGVETLLVIVVVVLVIVFLARRV